jgi:hypothetical protein
MDEGTSLAQAFGKHIVSLFISLLVATVAVLPFKESPEPGSLPRLVSVIISFTVFSAFFLWDKGNLRR